MGMVLRSIEKQLPEIAAQCAEVRRERNRSARRRRREAQGWAIEARRLETQTRAKLIRADRELERLLRFRIRILPEDRPKLSGRTARKLYDHAERLIGGLIGTSDVRGRDGLYSMYFGWRSRGLGAQEGRAWRLGEAARFARYITRETALEAGEDGWFSNVGEDRKEIVAFFRALENIERADRDNANVYISIIVPLPHDLGASARRRVAELITDALAVRSLPLVAALHLPDPGGDQRNFHLHVQLSLRPFERHAPFDWTFSAAKQTQLNTGAGIALMKRHAVRQINKVLAEQGIERRYTHRPRSRRGEAAGQMKRRRGSKAHEWAIERLEDAHVRWSILRDHARTLRQHITRHGELATRLARNKVRAQACNLRELTAGLNNHRDAVTELSSAFSRLRKTAEIKALSTAVTNSMAWYLRQHRRLARIKTMRSTRRRLFIRQADAALRASSAGLALQQERIGNYRFWQAGKVHLANLTTHRVAAAAFKQRLLKLKARAREQARGSLERDIMHARDELRQHRIDLAIAGALLAEARLRAAMSSAIRVLAKARDRLSEHRAAANDLLRACARLNLRRDPERLAAIREAASQVDKLDYVALVRSVVGGMNHYWPAAPADANESPSMAEVFADERPVQAAYHRKWHAMSAALSEHLEYGPQCPFEFEKDLVKLKKAGMSDDLYTAILAAQDDPEIKRILQFQAERWRKIEAQRLASRQKREAELEKARDAREKRVQLVLERIDAPARPGTFSSQERAGIRGDVQDIGAALAFGEMAIERDGNTYVFRAHKTDLAAATARLFKSAAGRAAVELLHWAADGRPPHAGNLPMRWTRRAPDERAQQRATARSNQPHDVDLQTWSTPSAEIGD